MRYSKEHKQETHARIVKRASVKLREHGAHGIGVADLMKEAGLTHGGFYAHFASREALVIEAFAYAMDRSTARWRRKAEETPADQRFATIIDSYLTPLHRDDPGNGCAVPALAAEIARESAKTRKAFAAKLADMIEMLAEQIPGRSRKAAREQAVAASCPTTFWRRVAPRCSPGMVQPGRVHASGWPRRSSQRRRAPGTDTFSVAFPGIGARRPRAVRIFANGLRVESLFKSA